MEGERSAKTPSGVWLLLTAALLLLAVGDAKADSQSAAPADSQSAAPEAVVHPLYESNFVVGHNFSLICKIPRREETTFSWITPNKDKVPLVEAQLLNVSGGTYQTSRITIQNASLEDSGQYICNVWVGGHVNSSYPYGVQVRESQGSFVAIDPATTDVTVDEGQKVAWVVSVAASPPEPSLTFRGPSGRDLKTSERVRTEVLPNKVEVVLHLLNLSRSDSGSYTVEAETRDGGATARATLRLRIRHSPKVSLPATSVIPAWGHKRVECRVEGYPLPKVTWKVQQCLPVKEECEESSEDVEVMSENVSETELVAWKAWQGQTPGILTCEATNSLGTDVAKTRIVISDISNTLVFRYIDNANLSNVIVDEEEVEVTEGDLIKLECGAVKSVYSGVTLESPEGTALQFEKSDSSLAWLLTNERQGVALADEGSYVCRGSTNNGSTPKDNSSSTSTLHLKIRPQVAPYLSGGTEALSKTHTVVLEEDTPQYTIHCRAKGFPSPKITWTKNGLPLVASERGPGIRRGGHEVVILSVKQDDAGLYQCQAENRVGTVNGSVIIKVIKPVDKTENTERLRDTVDLIIQENTKNFSIQCHVNASDPPQIIWTKDGHRFASSSDPKGPKISEDGIVITYPVVVLSDTGLYRCADRDHPGRVIEVTDLEVTQGHHWTYRLYGIFIIVVLLFLFVVSMVTQSCHNKVRCCSVLEGVSVYTNMNECDSRRSSQHTMNGPQT